MKKKEKNILEILNYFWNKKSKKPSKVISEVMIAILECGTFDDEPQFQAQKALARLGMVAMVGLGYVVQISNQDNVIIWGITDKGKEFLIKHHSTIKDRLQSLISSVPELFIIISGVLGLIASVAGIIQFLDWMRRLF